MILPDKIEIEQICVIVDFGKGSKILQTAKKHGISGGTVLLGRGTINNRVLDFLGLADIRKEIIMMITDKKTAEQAMTKLNEEFKFEKPNHGIAYIASVCALVGTRSCRGEIISEESGEDNNMYKVITVIVDKGNAESVIEAAAKAGSKGGTIINARGSGIHETSKLFSMDIEPEKELVLILSEKAMTEGIVDSIRKEINLDEPGKGILYVQDVNKTYGIYK